MNNKKKNYLKRLSSAKVVAVFSLVSMLSISIGTVYASSDCVPIAESNLCVAKNDLNLYSAINTCENKSWDGANYYCERNAWAGAKKACADIGMRLPNKAELNLLYKNNSIIGGFHTLEKDNPYYWSSSEYDCNGSWYQAYNTGIQYQQGKGATHRVRCVKNNTVPTGKRCYS